MPRERSRAPLGAGFWTCRFLVGHVLRTRWKESRGGGGAWRPPAGEPLRIITQCRVSESANLRGVEYVDRATSAAAGLCTMAFVLTVMSCGELVVTRGVHKHMA